MVFYYLIYSSATIVGGVFAWWLYARSIAEVPRLYAKPSKLKTALLERSTVLKEKYYPPFWSIWGTVHTIMRQLLKTHPVLPFEREVLKLQDGGQVALDWLAPIKSIDPAKAPIVIILPGLTGCTSESYVLHLALTTSTDGYRAVVFNNRGNGGVELLTPRTYSAANTDDLKAVVDHVRGRYPESSVMAAGFSLGGMIVFNYICNYNADDCGLKAAMVISSPWDPNLSTKILEEPIYRLLFNRRLAGNLCRSIERNRKMFENVLDVDHVLKSSLIREFDERFIVPMFKYKDVLEYYRDAGFYYKTKMASVPVLCLNASDDCFAPTESIPLEEIQQSENVMTIITNHGGHIAFMKANSFTDGGLIEELFSEYTKIVFDIL